MHHAADAQSRLPTDGTVNKSLEHKLPVLVMANGEKKDDTTTTIFVLVAHARVPAHFDTDAERTDATSPTIAEFMADHSANKFCQNDAWHLDQGGIKYSLSKRRMLLRRASIDEAVQKLVLYLLQQRLLNLSHHSPFSSHSAQCRMYDTM